MLLLTCKLNLQSWETQLRVTPTLSRKLKVSLGAAALGVSNAVKE